MRWTATGPLALVALIGFAGLWDVAHASACRVDTRVDGAPDLRTAETSLGAARKSARATPSALVLYRLPRPADLARRTFDSVNQERVRRGLPPLEWDDQIAALARAHSERMRDRRFFSHDDPERGNLEARIRRTNIRWRTVAENIFVENGFGNPVQQAVKSWLDSPGHRRNMLGPGFTRTGAGVATDGQGKYWFTQIFVGAGKP